MRALLVACAAGCALAATAPEAGASTPDRAGTSTDLAPVRASYRTGGRRWPGRPARIPYFTAATGYRSAVREAAAAWNASGARLRFVEVSRRRARVIVRYGPRLGPSVCFGFAQLGWAPRRTAGVTLSRGCDRDLLLQVTAHEFGHIIGLHHDDRRCASMNTQVASRCPNPPQPWLYRCRLLERDDIRGAVRRYGGRVRVNPRQFCERFPAPGAPSGLGVAGEDSGDGTPTPRISWRNSSSSHLVSVRITRRRDTCPTGPDDPQAALVYESSATRGANESTTDDNFPNETGHYCYAAWSLDEYGRASPSPATATLDWTRVEPPPEECDPEFEFC